MEQRFIVTTTYYREKGKAPIIEHLTKSQLLARRIHPAIAESMTKEPFEPTTILFLTEKITITEVRKGGDKCR